MEYNIAVADGYSYICFIIAFKIRNKNDVDAKASLTDGLSKIDYDTIRAQKEKSFQSVLNGQNYAEVLKIFNEKGLAREIGAKLGVDRREYQRKVINLISGECHGEIVRALKKYLPDGIPRD